MKKKYTEIKDNYLVSEWERAYLAGIVDGEGSIFIAKENPSKPNYMLRISISSTDKILIDWIYKRFGGNTCTQRKDINKKIVYHWRSSGPHAAKIISNIKEFLVIKKLKAEWAISFQNKKYKIGVHPLPLSKIIEYQWFKDNLSKARSY